MKFGILTFMLALALTIPVYSASQGYASAKIVQVQQHTRDRVLSYQVNTPIMAEDPYTTVTIDVGGRIYEGEFLPKYRHDAMPDFWKADDTVLVRLEKHFMYLNRADGSEAKFLLTSKVRTRAARESH